MTWGAASVVIATWNHGRLLAEALDSVLTQRERPAQVIVVDDASTDDTPRVLGRYPTVQALRQPRRQGPAAAFNRGFEVAATPWVFVLGADDTWGPDYVAAHRAVLEGALAASPAPVGYLCPPAIYVADGREVGRWATPEGVPCRHGACLFSRAAWAACGGFPDGPREDVGLQAAMDARGYRALPVPGTWYGYRQHELGHRNHGTDNVRDRDWGGRPVHGIRLPNITVARETLLRRSA